MDNKKLILIVKPTKECSYKNFVNALDELYINDYKHYFVAEPGQHEILINGSQ